jgi:hypothetical protein
MVLLIDRFQGGLWGMTIAQNLIESELSPELSAYLDYIPQVMMGHVSAVELLQVLSAGTFTAVDWSFYGTLSLAMAGEFCPTAQSFADWGQKKVALNQDMLTWARGGIANRSSLISVLESSKQLSLNSREQSIALALYGAMTVPGNWKLAFDRLVRVSSMPVMTAALLGCLIGVQGGVRAIPAELRLRYREEGNKARSQAEEMVRSWSGSGSGAIVTSPRRVHLS